MFAFHGVFLFPERRANRNGETEMGKRGPRRGMTYKKRILIPCLVRVGSDRQLRQAQTFNERLDALLAEWETAEIYPLNAVENRPPRTGHRGRLPDTARHLRGNIAI